MIAANDPRLEAGSPRQRLLAEAQRLDRERAILEKTLVDSRAATEELQILSVLNMRPDWTAPSDADVKLYDHIHRRVAEALGEGGVPLELDHQAVVDRFFTKGSYGSYVARPGFSAEAVMRAVLDEFEPKRFAMASAQQAVELYDCFIKYGEPRIVGGRTVLSHRAWLEDWPTTERAYSFNSRREIESALRYLAAVLPRITGDMDEVEAEASLHDCVREFEAARWVPSRTFRGHLGPIEIRLFQKKVEYWLPEEVAAALNLFVSMHLKQAA